MVLKRTENIFICIVIVCSVNIFEFTVIKYFQKIIIKVKKKKKKKKKKTIGRFVKSYACLYPFVFFLNKVLKKKISVISIIS